MAEFGVILIRTCSLWRWNEMYFEHYGRLEWLEPAEYYAGPWLYHRTTTGPDDVDYDIVISCDGRELRYTHV